MSEKRYRVEMTPPFLKSAGWHLVPDDDGDIVLRSERGRTDDEMLTELDAMLNDGRKFFFGISGHSDHAIRGGGRFRNSIQIGDGDTYRIIDCDGMRSFLYSLYSSLKSGPIKSN